MLNRNNQQRRADCRPPLPHQNESPAEYSSVGCSPAEPTSAFPAVLMMRQNSSLRQQFSANGNRPRNRVSQSVPQANGLHPKTETGDR